MLSKFTNIQIVMLLSSADFFQKNSFRNTIIVSNSLNPDQDRHLSALICVQTVCKGYQQTTKFSATVMLTKSDSDVILC